MADGFPRKSTGHIIVMTPAAFIGRYNASGIATENQSHLARLRKATASLDIGSYRGMGRDALEPFPSLDPAAVDAFANTGLDMESNHQARQRYRELIGEDQPDDAEEALMNSADQAQEVHSLLERPEDWELIRLTRGIQDPTPTSFGFDIGWWAGQPYSLIADTVVAPRWHPPDEEDLDDVLKALGTINRHLLFDTYEDAVTFKGWYTTKPWAESEDAPFDVVLIEPA